MLKNKKGFTLLEVMIAIAIFGVLSVSLLAVFSMSLSFISQAKLKSSAGYDLQADVETDLNTAITTSASPTAIQIIMPTTGTINISGTIIVTTDTIALDSGHDVTITYFKPAN